MSASPGSFPRTKLLAPELHKDFVRRPRLDLLIEENVVARRFTLISAPAGYGKTTAALSWAHKTERFKILWVSLDSLDSDPLQFLNLLITALQQLNPACGLALQPTLAGQTTASLDPKRAFGMLVNDILDNLPVSFALILDDLHTLRNPDLFGGLDYFIANLPPAMRLLATVRQEPPLSLALLRGRDQVSEIGPPDLRFTFDEVARLMESGLNHHMSQDEVRALYDHTEGWVAGLRLLAGSFRSEDRRSEVRLQERNVARRSIFDLLAGEVLNKQGPEIRRFLLQTSILEELTPELCARLTENPDADLLLQEIYRRNLFLSAFIDSGKPHFDTMTCSPSS
jgi:LuxR family maltose regulon positive regulatory protein